MEKTEKNQVAWKAATAYHNNIITQNPYAEAYGLDQAYYDGWNDGFLVGSIKSMNHGYEEAKKDAINAFNGFLQYLYDLKRIDLDEFEDEHWLTMFKEKFES